MLACIISNNASVNTVVRQLLSLPVENNLNIILGAVAFVLIGGAAVITGIFLIEYGLKSVVKILSIENHSTIRSLQSKPQSLRPNRAQVI